MSTLQNQIALHKNGKMDNAVGLVDGAVMSSIFSLFLESSAKEFLEATGRYYLFPIAALAGLIKAGLTIREAYLDKKRGTAVRAVVETVSAVAITTAVVGALAAGSLFVLASPIIFTTVLAAKSLFHLGLSIYNLGKAAVSAPEDKPKYVERAKMNAFGGLVTALITVSVAMVFIAAKPIFAVLGVIGSALGIGMGLFRGYKQYQEAKKLQFEQAHEPLITENENDLSSSYQIAKQLGNNKAQHVNNNAQGTNIVNISSYQGGKFFDKQRVQNVVNQEQAVESTNTPAIA